MDLFILLYNIYGEVMKKIIIILILFILSLMITIFLINKNNLNITFFAYQKSDSILITYKDKVVLIDTSLESYSNALINNLNKKNIKTIDYLILTHFDKDHIGSSSKVIDNFNIKNILTGDYIKESEYYNNYIDSINRKNLKPIEFENVYKFNIYDLEFMVYKPNKEYESDSSNNSSLVVSLKYKNNKFLFTGDIENERIKDLDNLDTYDLIKMPHHGKYNKELDNLLDKVKVKYAIITNDSIDTKTINLLNNKNIKYYYTNDKNIYVKSDGNKIYINN